jgi:hypothetical protein
MPIVPVDMIALNRLAFGPTDMDSAAFRQLGFERWLDLQLSPGSDTIADQRVADATLHIKYGAGASNEWPAVDEMRPLRTLKQPISETWALLDPDPKKVPPPEKNGLVSRWRPRR